MLTCEGLDIPYRSLEPHRCIITEVVRDGLGLGLSATHARRSSASIE